MKKVERLRWVEETFGKEFVLPYWVCTEWPQIELAVQDMDNKRRTWGLRTDLRNGQDQGYQLPFVHHGNKEEVKKIFDEHQGKLLYIVCENVLIRKLSGVAIKIDQEHVLFEWNDKETTISQRAMYKHPENLRQMAFGPNNLVFPWDGGPIRSTRPEYGAFFKFDEIYDVMIHSDVDETTFTVRDDGKVIVW